jgi:hypothetical protein
MSYRRPVESVQDYTNAFLVWFGVLLFIGFCFIAVAFGYIWVAIVAYALNATFRWIGRRINSG